MTTRPVTDADEKRCGPVAWFVLPAIVLVAIYVRQIPLRDSLWVDELHTAWVVNGQLDDVAHRAMMGNQPPLPYWVLWAYVQLAGVSELSLRLPSLVASVASIVLIFFLARSWLSSTMAGLVAAGALAVESNAALFYASEARVYALVQLLALAQLFAFERALSRGTIKWRALSVVLAWLLFYTHYTSGLLLVAEAVTWLVMRVRDDQLPYRVRAVAIDVAIFALGCLPALPHLRMIFARRDNWKAFVERPGWEDLVAMVPQGRMLLMVLGAWTTLLVLRRLGAKRPLCHWPRPPVMVLVGAWLMVPLLLAWSLSLADVARVFHLRYLVYVLPATGMLLALLTPMIPTRSMQRLFAFGAVAWMAAFNASDSFPVLSGSEKVRTEDWRGAMKDLSYLDDDDLVFLAAGLIEADALRTSDDPALREYCLFPLHAAYPLKGKNAPREVPLPFHEPGRLSKRNQQMIREHFKTYRDACFLVRGSEAFSREVAKDVKESLGPDVYCHHRTEMDGVYLFYVQLIRPRSFNE
jgi:mannosyltransferase